MFKFVVSCIGLVTVLMVLSSLGNMDNAPSTAGPGPGNIAAYSNGQYEAPKTAPGAVSLKDYPVLDPSTVELQKFNWKLDGFGTVFIASFTIKNNNDFAIKDVDIRCVTLGGSGTELSRKNHTVYELVPAKGTKVIRELNVGFVDQQSKRGGCEVRRFSRA